MMDIGDDDLGWLLKLAASWSLVPSVFCVSRVVSGQGFDRRWGHWEDINVKLSLLFSVCLSVSVCLSLSLYLSLCLSLSSHGLSLSLSLTVSVCLSISLCISPSMQFTCPLSQKRKEELGGRRRRIRRRSCSGKERRKEGGGEKAYPWNWPLSLSVYIFVCYLYALWNLW